MNKISDPERKKCGYLGWPIRNDLSLIYLLLRNNMNSTERSQEIQEYLTVVLLQDMRMNKYFHILDTIVFWKYKKVWDYVIKNGNGNQPDLVDVAYSCGIVDQEKIMNLAYTDFVWDPVRYLKELLERYYFSNPSKMTMEEYENLVNIKNEIDKIQSWEWEKQYSIEAISSELMDSVYSNSYKTHTKTLIPELDEIIWWWVLPWTVTRITAYSNTGKSKLAYFLASNLLKQWKKTLFINLEVPKDTVLQNILASYSGKHLNDIIKTQGMNAIWDYLNEYTDLPLTIVDNKWDWESISSFIISHKPEVVFIDFIQNIEIEWNNVYEQMSKLAKRIQRLAIEQNIIIIDVSQMSNDGAKNYKIGDMIPSKWGGELVASTDIGLVLTSNSERGDILNLYVAKNKFWRKEDCIELQVNYKLNRFNVLSVTWKKTFSN